MRDGKGQMESFMLERFTFGISLLFLMHSSGILNNSNIRRTNPSRQLSGRLSFTVLFFAISLQ